MERLDAIEMDIELLKHQYISAAELAQQHKVFLSQEIAKEKNERKESAHSLHEFHKSVQTDGIPLAVVGLQFVGFGLIFSAFPEVFAGWFL